MTHVMTLTDYTTTFNLTSGSDCRLLDYEPSTPNISPQEAISLIVDGGEMLNAHIANVTESGRFEILGTSVADLQANIRTVERLFLQARERQRRKGGADRVYVTLAMSGEGLTWRSEIMLGYLSLASNVFKEWGNLKAEVVITWQRRFYWEGEEGYLTLRDPVTDTNVTEVEVANHHSGSSRNYVQIVGSGVDGSLPAACRIQIENTSGASVGYDNVYIGQGIWIDAEDFDHMLQAEDNETGGGSDTSSGTSSGGYYHAVSWTGASTYSTLRYSFTLSGAQQGYANGGFFRLLARFAVAPNATTYVRAEIANGPTVFYRAPEIKLRGYGIEELGVVQIPPSLSELPPSSFVMSDLSLNIYARDTVSGTLSIDYIQLTPLDGWRQMRIVGTNFADGSTIYDDGLLGIAYTDDAVEGAVGNIIATGQPILVWPGRTQRLYILFDEDTGGSTISRTNDVRVAYRPRRMTL